MLNLVTSRWVRGISLGVIFIAILDTAYSSNNFVKVPSSRISKLTKIVALKTFQGRFINIKMIKGLKNKVKVKALDIMNRPQIELKNGEIIYPEEVNFFISKKKKSIFKQPVISARAPEGDD